MKRGTKARRVLTLSVACAAVALISGSHLIAGAGVQRTVYFSAVDGNGAFVSDLAQADLTVKENGKDQTIQSVAAATAPMQVVLIVDDAGSGAFQAGVAKFIETTQNHAEFAITALEPQPMKVTDFTQNVEDLRAAINRVGPRGRMQTVGEQVMNAVEAASKDLQKRKAARPVIVVMTVGGEQPQSNEAEPALNALKASGAGLNVVYLNGVELGKVLGDGPKRSGGVTATVSSGVALGPVLDKVAQNLMHQYVLTYTLPDGVKPNEKLALATSRKGVTLIAPTKLPDK
jgi:VWFA-related protein